MPRLVEQLIAVITFPDSAVQVKQVESMKSEIDDFASRYTSVNFTKSDAMDQPSDAVPPSPTSTEGENLSNGQGGDDEPGTSGSNAEFIEHVVLKSDTLAGLAIKHNVGVSDITRANGLMSESMMWSRCPSNHLHVYY